MNVQSIALLFEEGLGQKIQHESKTMTTRVWSHAQFTVVEKAVARGALLPCKTGYDRDSRFGYVLGLELRQRTLCSMTARELQYEGTDDANWEDFAARWAPGVPTDVTSFTNENGDKKIIFSLRFLFIDNTDDIPKLIKDLPSLWKGREHDACGVCRLPFLSEDEAADCLGCNNKVHVVDCCKADGEGRCLACLSVAAKPNIGSSVEMVGDADSHEGASIMEELTKDVTLSDLEEETEYEGSDLEDAEGGDLTAHTPGEMDDVQKAVHNDLMMERNAGRSA